MSHIKNKIKYSVSVDIPTKQPYFYFYKITTDFNNKYYYGVHKTFNLDDGYPGSGYALKKDIEKYGIEHFNKEILKFFNTSEEMYLYEEKIVNQDLLDDKLSYNLKLGGYGGWDTSINCVTVRDSNGNCFRVSKDDIRYLSGEVVHNMIGRVNVIDKDTGVHLQISTTEYDRNKSKYTPIFLNKVVARDADNNIVHISKDEYDSGNYVGVTKGFGVFKDKFGNVVTCNVNDERVINGELVGYTKGKTIFKKKDDFTKTLFLDKNDPRVLSGEYVGINFGMYTAYDKFGNKYRISKNDPRREELMSAKKYYEMKRKSLLWLPFFKLNSTNK